MPALDFNGWALLILGVGSVAIMGWSLCGADDEPALHQARGARKDRQS